MTNIAEAALERFKHASLPLDDEALLEPLAGSDPYWEMRRQNVASVLLNSEVLGLEVAVEEILRGEATGRAHAQREEYIAARLAAAEAVVADDSLPGDQKLQELVGLELGRYDGPGGHYNHIDAITWILEKTASDASDGLLMKLDFTEAESHADIREFISATPYKVDPSNLGYYVFKLASQSEDITPTSSLVTPDSGLYFRHSLDVRAWQRDQGLPDEPGFITYGIQTAYEDKYTWAPFGGYGWAGGEYPVIGSAVFRGQAAIAEFVSRMMSFGGERLAKIQSDVGDYPGFEFIHDIEPQGKIGADRRRVATTVEA